MPGDDPVRPVEDEPPDPNLTHPETCTAQGGPVVPAPAAHGVARPVARPPATGAGPPPPDAPTVHGVLPTTPAVPAPATAGPTRGP